MTRWAMVIDLDRCTACNACTVACKAENNVPHAVPAEGIAGRGIYWNEVLPYTTGSGASVSTQYVPRPCMHCESPSCVKVCPVGATFKDSEGLVLQNYDRCIGCRYCMTACPYGARYFNWRAPSRPDPMTKYLNPQVQQRPIGVVEKCTFCKQRIDDAKARAQAEGRKLKDGDVVPACVQTCTGGARVFGDLDDPTSAVSQLANSRRAFRMLEDLGNKPKVVYLQEG